MIIVSLLWSILVGVLGYEEQRPWGSFFLQYLWEFGLGMWIAEKCYWQSYNCKILEINSYRWWWLLLGTIAGMGLSALMAWNGGWLKLYNDIPSLFGYLSVALLIYKVGIKYVNRFFEYANGFSYELYLVYSLMFVIIAYCLEEVVPVCVLLSVNLIAAYVAGYSYSWLLMKTKLK